MLLETLNAQCRPSACTLCTRARTVRSFSSTAESSLEQFEQVMQCRRFAIGHDSIRFVIHRFPRCSYCHVRPKPIAFPSIQVEKVINLARVTNFHTNRKETHQMTHFLNRALFFLQASEQLASQLRVHLRRIVALSRTYQPSWIKQKWNKWTGKNLHQVLTLWVSVVHYL